MFGPPGPYEPGREDRVLADFQAKMLAREAEGGEPPPQAAWTARIPRFVSAWVLLLVAGSLIAIVFSYPVVYIAVAGGLALYAVVQIAMAVRRRTRHGAADKAKPN